MDDEYRCEICDKLISEEEYEENGGVCAECNSDINVHYQEYGLDDYTKPYIDLIDDPDVYDEYINGDDDDFEDDDYFDNDNSLDDFDEF